MAFFALLLAYDNNTMLGTEHIPRITFRKLSYYASSKIIIITECTGSSLNDEKISSTISVDSIIIIIFVDSLCTHNTHNI